MPLLLASDSRLVSRWRCRRPFRMTYVPRPLTSGICGMRSSGGNGERERESEKKEKNILIQSTIEFYGEEEQEHRKRHTRIPTGVGVDGGRFILGAADRYVRWWCGPFVRFAFHVAGRRFQARLRTGCILCRVFPSTNDLRNRKERRVQQELVGRLTCNGF